MNKDAYFKSVENAEKALIEWCKNEKIPIHCVQNIATFEEWDDGIGVLIFLGTYDDVKNTKESEKQKIFQRHKYFLKEYNYPFTKFPNVRYELDSHENVVENYEGSYFYRLR